MVIKSPSSIFLRDGSAWGMDELIPDATIASKLKPSAPLVFNRYSILALFQAQSFLFNKVKDLTKSLITNGLSLLYILQFFRGFYSSKSSYIIPNCKSSSTLSFFLSSYNCHKACPLLQNQEY